MIEQRDLAVRPIAGARDQRHLAGEVKWIQTHA